MPISFNTDFTADSDLTVDTSLADAAGESRVSVQLGKVTTPYREAERFLGYLAAVLTMVDAAAKAIEVIPSFFDINTAVGDQLTILGKRLGFPRCHCVCGTQPLIGFACDDGTPGPPIVGACEGGVWRGCGGVSDLCLYDDEVYRAHLLARRYQMLGLYDPDSLSVAIRAIWGEAAWVPRSERGQIVIAPGRVLTGEEGLRLPVSLRALPIAPTMEIALHYGTAPLAGFGVGWGAACETGSATPVHGFACGSTAYTIADACDPKATWADCADRADPASEWLCPVVVDPYRCGNPPPRPVHGFEGLDDGVIVAGFGEPEATWAGCLI